MDFLKSSIKVYAEINSKSGGNIKRFAELNIGEGVSLLKDKLLTQGAASYTSFEWSVPNDINLHSLHIMEAEGH